MTERWGEAPAHATNDETRPTRQEPEDAIQLKHWKHGPTIHHELLTLGAPAVVARQVAANSRYLLNSIVTIAYFDRLGMPRLS